MGVFYFIAGAVLLGILFIAYDKRDEGIKIKQAEAQAARNEAAARARTEALEKELQKTGKVYVHKVDGSQYLVNSTHYQSSSGIYKRTKMTDNTLKGCKCLGRL